MSLKSPEQGTLRCIDGAAVARQVLVTCSDPGMPVFACTPDRFPERMAAALGKQNIALWAAKEDLVVKR